MAWCPKCRNEYVEGITVCADCGSQLVETLPPEREEVGEWQGAMLSPEVYPGFGQRNPEWDDETADTGQEDQQSDYGEEESGQKGKNAGAAMTGAYKDNAQKAADFKDSGYTLVGVGAAGLIVVVLSAAGVIPIRISGSAAILSYGVMGAMFAIFFVIGIRSMQSAKTYKKKALTESNLKDQIMTWCRENLTAENVDGALFMEGLPEEEKYFRRTERIREKISHSFINIEEGFLDNLIDEFYPEIFEERS